MSAEQIYIIKPEPSSIEEAFQILENPDLKIRLSSEAIQSVTRCREYLEAKIIESEDPIYGINTGFGSLCNTHIESTQLAQLQINLIRSHACGAGGAIPTEIVRLILFLKIRALSFGHSGITLETLERLVLFFNEGIYPEIFEYGSLGASGDLAPLAHMSLGLIGEGKVNFRGQLIPAGEAHEILGISPLEPQSKEGLALLNGTQFMLAYGIYTLWLSGKLIQAANAAGALSIEGFDGRIEPFHPALHRIRPQVGQGIIAGAIRQLLEGSELISRPKKHVQDPYAFRCIPQVHGASWDAIQYAQEIFQREYNGVSDNPNIFPEEDLILSGGNFHGQPLALALDFLSLALSELGSISERRIYQLMGGNRNLPAFLTPNPGINSGLMILQYTAAGIASDNKRNCMPSSADSIPSSNGQEDHVSMGANAALKCAKIADNVASILGMELIAACQALEFRRPGKSSPALESIHSKFRKVVPPLEYDRILQPDIARASDFLRAEF